MSYVVAPWLGLHFYFIQIGRRRLVCVPCLSGLTGDARRRSASSACAAAGRGVWAVGFPAFGSVRFASRALGLGVVGPLGVGGGLCCGGACAWRVRVCVLRGARARRCVLGIPGAIALTRDRHFFVFFAATRCRRGSPRSPRSFSLKKQENRKNGKER